LPPTVSLSAGECYDEAADFAGGCGPSFRALPPPGGRRSAPPVSPPPPVVPLPPAHCQQPPPGTNAFEFSFRFFTPPPPCSRTAPACATPVRLAKGTTRS